MDTREGWDLRMPPARYLLHHRRGTHGDLARRLVKADLDKARQRRLTLLRLSHRIQRALRTTRQGHERRADA